MCPARSVEWLAGYLASVIEKEGKPLVMTLDSRTPLRTFNRLTWRRTRVALGVLGEAV
jgi:hypothetical protein